MNIQLPTPKRIRGRVSNFQGAWERQKDQEPLTKQLFGAGLPRTASWLRFGSPTAPLGPTAPFASSGWAGRPSRSPCGGGPSPRQSGFVRAGGRPSHNRGDQGGEAASRGRFEGRGRGRKNMCFCETKPIFSGMQPWGKALACNCFRKHLRGWINWLRLSKLALFLGFPATSARCFQCLEGWIDSLVDIPSHAQLRKTCDAEIA